MTTLPRQSEQAVSGQAEARPSTIEHTIGVAPKDLLMNTTTTAAMSIGW
jgi:hypothetical protein